MDNPDSEFHDLKRDYSDDDLIKIRSLIVGPEQKSISRLKERLDNPEIRANELSNILAEAILLRTSKDNKLALALLPTIENVIKDSVKRDPQFLANVIFPVIGPAIRKSIAESFRAMMQSFSEALEYSISWKGLKWRWESLRTGRPFAEVVLLHTLLYRVEQVFLIHLSTGLVLQHVAAQDVVVHDKEMVSGMLTAIQDFIKDSFGITEGQSLHNMNVGDLTIWIEQGVHTVLATVIRGNPPQDLRITLEETIEKIEFEQRQALELFEGDSSQFIKTHPLLESCLIQVRGADKTKPVITATKKVEQDRKSMVSQHSEVSKPVINLQVMLILVAIICFAIIVAGYILSPK